MNLVECQCIRNKLTPENLSELGPGKDQLEMGCRQILLDSKAKAWVDEQNKINKEKGPRYDRSYDEGRDLMHLDPQLDVESPVKCQKKGTAVTLEKEKDAPQPSHALQQFIKYIADPLVDKGWNLHLKFEKGNPRGSSLSKALPNRSPQLKLTKKKKLVNPK